MEIADLAAKAVRSLSKQSGRNMKRRKTAPPISPHMIKHMVSDNGKFEVGYAMREVMPDDVLAKDYWVAGHGMGHKMEGVHDPITARAMWIGCPGSGGIVMCAIDCIGLTGADVDGVRERLVSFSRRSDCRSINISATHTHGGFDTLGYWGKLPRTGKDKDYMELLFSSICEIVNEAYDNRTTGDLYLGTAHVPDAQYDKREPIVLHDTLTRFRFVPDDGSTETWFLNFAAHPNTLGGDNRMCSADYPYYLRERINASKPVNVLFAIGAIGAVDPGDYCDDVYERTRIEGERLGDAALSIDNDRKLEARITELRQPFYIPADNGVLAFLASLNVMTSKRYPYDKGDLGLAMKSELTYLKIGDQRVLLLPGESFPETVYGGYASADVSATGQPANINPRPLCEIAGDDDLLVFGNTNDMTGYVVPPNDFVLHPTQPYLSTARDRFNNRHYHETNSLGYYAQEAIADTFAAMMERIREDESPAK